MPAPAAAVVVEVDHVTRTFGPLTALDDVSLEVEAGEAVGVLGPNGAGKSTLLSLLAGLRRPDRGTVRVAGGDPRTRAPAPASASPRRPPDCRRPSRSARSSTSPRATTAIPCRDPNCWNGSG